MPSRPSFRAFPPAAALAALLSAPCAAPPPAAARDTDHAADYLHEPSGGGENARCDWIERLRRFTDETKRDCDDGRAVKSGPITAAILDRCRSEQGAAFGRRPIDDLLDGFGRQVRAQGLGNACHEIKQRAWDLIAQ